MGLDDIAKGALLLIGAGIVAERFGAGTGLAGLGTGIQTIVASPGTGVGTGLSGTARGLTDIGKAIGDIGRGFGTFFEQIPKIPDWWNVPVIPWIGEPKAPAARIPLPILQPLPYYPIPKAGGGDSNVENLSATPKPGGITHVANIAGNGFTFSGARTIWKTREAAEKNYRQVHGSDPTAIGGTNV